jgi:uncharacterized membrane protein
MDPVDDPLNYKWGIFYNNKQDIRTVVPKRIRGLGWTLNFAHPVSYVFMGLFLMVILASALFVLYK